MFAKKAYNISWSQFYDWIKALHGGSIAITFGSFKVMVGRLEKKRAELSRNKKHDELEHLLFQPFSMQQEYTSSEEAGMSELSVLKDWVRSSPRATANNYIH